MRSRPAVLHRVLGPVLVSGLLFCALGVGPGARAAAIEHFVGTITVQLFPLPPLVVTGEGFAHLDPAAPPLVALQLEEAALSGSAATVLPTDVTLYHPFREIQLSVRNGAGTLVDGSGLLPLRGLYRACLFATCDALLYDAVLPLTANGTRGVGLGGAIQTSDEIFLFTVRGAPWTLGRVSAATPFGDPISGSGFVHSPASGTSFGSVARHGGALQMVTPFFIDVVSRDGSVNYTFPGIATFHAVFAPEPGTALLLGLGVAGLAIRGRSARRSDGGTLRR